MASSTPTTTTPPPVSALRSRFEKLAQETSPKGSKFESNGYLSPESSNSHLRRRTSSNASGDIAPSSPDSHALRTSVSSSDLKAAKRKPPPPPPTSRPSTASSFTHASPTIQPLQPGAGNGAGPSVSPLLRPQDAPVLAQPAGSPRKPPPPPMRTVPNGLGLESDTPASLAHVRSKFMSPPNLPSAANKPAGNRIVSHPIQTSPPLDEDLLSDSPSASIASHNHRYSLSSLPTIVTETPPMNPRTSPHLAQTLVDRPTAPPLPHRNTHSFSEAYPKQNRQIDSNGLDQGDNSQLRTQALRRATNQPPPPPPRPPPRHAGSTPVPQLHNQHTNGASSSEPSSSSITPTLQVPPPLPVRRSPPMRSGDLPTTLPPPLPLRKPFNLETDPHAGSASAPPATTDRKSTLNNLPPPPTRTIALGDKLPPARRPASGGSSDESGDEEEVLKGKPIDLLPDASNASRRPPIISTLFAQFKVHVPAHGVVAASGPSIVTVHHDLKVYNLTVSDSPVLHISAKELASDLRVKELKVTCLEFRCTENPDNRGSLLWLGLKEGHLFEIDIRTGAITSVKFSAHGHPVNNIFRRGRTMISIDESGKALVYNTEPGEEISLSTTQPRATRISDRQGFVKLIGDLLWTSGGPGSGSSSSHNTNTQSIGGTIRPTPIIRVYDIMSATCTSKTLIPVDHVGPVTAGTILPSQPDRVYLGHEGGGISVWNVKTDDGVPACLEVVKVSVSDILCLEGVNNRLWAGGRKGVISAYDVEHKPWLVTNAWQAHQELPVQKLLVDPWSIEKAGQLTVISVGRDDQARFWDGCLGIDWIDKELHHRESSFSSFRELKVLIVSWNVDAAKPDTLMGTPENLSFLDNALKSVDSPDIIVFGFQELIDLENRKMAAKTVLLGGKKKQPDGTMSEKVSRSYKMWYDKLVLAVRLAMPPDCPYTVVHAENLVGLFTCIIMKNTERAAMKDAEIKTIKRGMGGRYGNKGAIVGRLVIDDSSMCFINCHLAAGQNHVRSRNADVAAILEEKMVFPEPPGALEPLAYVGGGDGSMVLDHEIVFLNGDLNYRIDQRREPVCAAVNAGEVHALLPYDQLLKEMKNNRGFRLRSFMEGPITFAPTYKYDRRSSEYDTSEKRRVPAWCDRILWRCREPSRVRQLHYQRYEANVSDHRPISAAFTITVKSVHHDARAQAKSDLDGLWHAEQKQILYFSHQFYLSQGII